MIILIAGASHAGKTVLAQKLLERLGYPYLSIDHLKMGLIRSSHTHLTPESPDQALTDFLWPIVREMVKTAVENGQNLIVEGCYIPFDWKKDFGESYLREIRYVCLILTEAYIRAHFDRIQAHASDVEKRLDDSSCTPEALIRDNQRNLKMCRKFDCPAVLIEDEYKIDVEDILR